ncbi:hypothetical protein WA158_001628 [Blastocystis sp. Blastoise]
MLSTFSKRFASNVTFRSKLFIPRLLDQAETQKDVSESYKLMLKGGFLRQTGSGLYMLLPEGKKIMDRIEDVVDEHLGYLGAQKMQMPILLTKDLWEKTGRWEGTGKEMFKLKDRKGRDYCLGPTHEELFTKMVRDACLSYKSLPLLIYQNGYKYRDEFRPRDGLMRSREFCMSDMYSFHSDPRDALLTYRDVSTVYMDIFNNLDINIVKVDADGGNISNNLSHEYMYINKNGEDQICTCDACSYASNVEIARCYQYEPYQYKNPDYIDIFQPKLINTRDYSSFLSELKRQEGSEDYYNIWKMNTNKGDVYCLMGLQDKPNKVKIQKSGALNTFLLDNRGDKENTVTIQGEPAAISRDQIPTDIKYLLLDMNIPGEMSNHIQKLGGKSVIGGDYRYVQEGDTCLCLKGGLHVHSATELGHTFYLSDQYSSKLGLSLQNKEKKEVNVEMGCYGLGLSRILASMFDIYGYSRGVLLPQSVASYDVVVIDKNKTEKNTEVSKKIMDELTDKDPDLRILYDDRLNVSIGQKIKDAELIGGKLAIVLGKTYMDTKEVNIRLLHNVIYDDLDTDVKQKQQLLLRYRMNQLYSRVINYDWTGLSEIGFFHGEQDVPEKDAAEKALEALKRI